MLYTDIVSGSDLFLPFLSASSHPSSLSYPHPHFLSFFFTLIHLHQKILLTIANSLLFHHRPKFVPKMLNNNKKHFRFFVLNLCRKNTLQPPTVYVLFTFFFCIYRNRSRQYLTLFLKYSRRRS